QAVYTLMTYMARMASQQGWSLAFDRPAMLQAAQYMGSRWSEYFLTTTEGMEQVKWIELMEDMVTLDAWPQYTHGVLDAARRVMLFRQARQMMLAAGNKSAHPDSKQLIIAQEG